MLTMKGIYVVFILVTMWSEPWDRGELVTNVRLNLESPAFTVPGAARHLSVVGCSVVSGSVVGGSVVGGSVVGFSSRNN